MLIRPLREEERELYNSVVDHPVQAWEWGEFRKKTGLKVDRIGFFDNGKLKKALQVTYHPVPLIGMNVGYVARAYMPDEEQLDVLKQLGRDNNCIFIKLEPNIAEKVGVPSAHPTVVKFLADQGAVPGRPFFIKHTFQLQLNKPEEELFAQLSSKTRYNINLAFKKGVQIFENTSAEGMEQYIDVLSETTKRQGFYAHTPHYFRTMWESVGQSGLLRIFNAVYDNQILVSWVMFLFNGNLYYPYGASRSIHRDVMASNLMMWEMIKFGKAQGCQMFDMWGSLGPEPDPKDPRFGFHRFKKGYGGDLVEFLGSFDLVLNQPLYKLYRLAENVRWSFLKIKARFRR